MQLLDDTPRLPKLPFFIGDALLLLAAGFIASRSDDPIGTASLLGIVLCVGLGAALAVIPFLVDYARRQDEALEERQQTLAALARDVSASAEQISIAAAAAPGLAQNAAHAGKLAEQLPKLIQDKIHQLKDALAEAGDAEIENLRQELATLRSAETERLAEVVEKLDRTTVRLVELLVRWEQLPAQTEAAAKELQTALKSLAKAKPASPRAERVVTPPAAAPEPEPQPTPVETVDVVEDTPPEPPHPARAATEPPSESAPEPELTPEPAAETAADAAPDPASPSAAESAPESSPAPEPEPETEPEPAVAAPRPSPRRKAPPPIDDNPDLFETNVADDEPAEPSSARSADGATRLIVTAYIGIGNKLYVRGEGPGLSPDHGVPLQFVSIGKWRWETDHAESPLKVRLYKNDQIECTALGEVVLKPGHQHEVGATF